MAAPADPIATGHRPTRPSAWIERFAPLVRTSGLVLDLACGSGRHGRLFLDRSHPVTFVDLDVRGVEDLRTTASAILVQADLEGTAPWPLPGQRFAAVIVTNYLHRPLIDAILAALEPGGLLLYETFMRGHARFGRPSCDVFLLRSGELLALASAHGMQVIAFEQGEVASPRAAIIQRLCAVAAPALAADLDGDPEPRPLPSA